MRCEDIGQRVDDSHDVFLSQVAAPVFGPSRLELGRILRVAIEALPPEGHQESLPFIVHHVVAQVSPCVVAPTLQAVAVSVGQVHVPHHQLEARILAVAPLVELDAEAISVHIMAQFHRQLVIDEGHHVNIVTVVAACQRILHQVHAVVDVVTLTLFHVLIVGELVLEQDMAVGVRCTVVADGVVLGNIGHVIVVVHLHHVVAGEGVALVSGLPEVESVSAFGR